MRADNHGEGGTLTLMALLQQVMGRNFFIISLLGMAGAALRRNYHASHFGAVCRRRSQARRSRL